MIEQIDIIGACSLYASASVQNPGEFCIYSLMVLVEVVEVVQVVVEVVVMVVMVEVVVKVQ